MSKLELADILRDVVASGQLQASKEQWKVVNSIMNCRTSALGGHLYCCQECGQQQPRYNSCRNRHCPKCQGGAIAKWLEQRAEELLPVPYFHTVFTIPHELNGIVLQNKKLLYDILFKAVSKTLKDVSQRRLGGKIGFFSLLHTWGQKLEAHPHLHCVIPGAVLNKDGSVKTTSENYFLPKEVLSLVFRAIFCKLLEKAHPNLLFQGQQEYLADGRHFQCLLQKLQSKTWIVYPKKPFSGPETVLKYLARYTHRVAISNSRILSSGAGETTFSYKDYSAGGARREITLETSEFVRRFLLHVLPKGFVRIRHFGFMATANRSKSLLKLKTMLGARPLAEVSQTKKSCCSSCGSDKLVIVGKIPRKIVVLSTALPRSKKPKLKELPLVA